MPERRTTRTRGPRIDELAHDADEQLADEPDDELAEDADDELAAEPEDELADDADDELDDDAEDEPAEEEPRRAGRSQSNSTRRHSGRGHSDGLTAAKASQLALRQIAELTGKAPEGVTGIERSEDGWLVGVEVIEDRRIPSSTDILATYETEIDTDGDLVSYRRVRRYTRGRGDSEDA